MGSIQVEQELDQTGKQSRNGLINKIPQFHTNGDSSKKTCKSFELPCLAANRSMGQTSTTAATVLVSWLIVLLRTEESSDISFEWKFKSHGESYEKRSLSMNEIGTGLQSSVEEFVTQIASQNETSSLFESGSVSLLLSTGSLSTKSVGAKEEDVLQLEVSLNSGRLEIQPEWYTESIPEYTIDLRVETLVDTIKLCLSTPQSSIQKFMQPTARDMDAIWGWNNNLAPTYEYCMHDIISERAQASPDKVAISSWDGSLTYAQVDQYSTLIASSLKELGVQLHDVLPICSEKSRWAVVAVLGAMKVGATFVLMDPSLPLARLQNMAEQVGAKTMLSTRLQHDLSTSIIGSGKLLVVEADTFAKATAKRQNTDLPVVPASALMYIIFTSGSTGTPKGVKVSHEAYTSSAFPRAAAVGYTEESRVLDFASYAFDVSIDSMLLTLGNGGCLCIPSDEDRVNDINGVIRSYQINYAGLTPSVARILDPDVITSLSGLGLGGEAASVRDVTRWGKDTRIIIGYGPCECTIGCTINSSAATGRNYISIGTGNGAAIWIVDPDNHELLVPVGAVGELLVEGPIVGQGYLNDPEKTAASFIEDPQWLLTGHKGYAGRRYSGRKGRLYKTGDLGRYDPDGSGGIVFVGRKDTQVKLRGQRVELGEIESQLQARLPPDMNIIAEVIVPLASGGQPTLVAFISPPTSKGSKPLELMLTQLPDDLRAMLSEVDAELSKVLPRYMVPTAYIPVNYTPVLISGKTDRKQLRLLGTTVDLRQLDQNSDATSDRELSNIEQRLREAWGQILNVDSKTIKPNDNFFALGGDSLSAMRLVSICREQGLDIGVAMAFGHPTLSAMAGVVKVSEHAALTEIEAFSMISQSVESACLEASDACDTRPEEIEDIFACTPTQESLFTFSLKSNKAYVAQRIAKIPPQVSLDAWKHAWEEAIAASPILRTRLAQLQEPGLQQVVIKEGITWRYSSDLAQYLETDKNEKMELGQSLARYAIVENAGDEERYMVWTLHHVLYDGWSEPLILQKVSKVLQNQSIEKQSQMKDFVKFVRDTDVVAMEEFWRQELKGATGPQFPALPTRDFLPTPTTILEHRIPLEISSGWPFTMATLIRGAWTLVASQYTGSDDVVFGETLTGRDISLSGVENIVGPLIATVPIRMRINRTSSVESYLQAVQQSMVARTPYQHMGMQYIRKVSQDAQHACEAGTGLVIQPDPEYTGGDLGFDQGDVVREAIHFNPYPLMLACGILRDGFRICASFDSSIIGELQIGRILKQLEMACIQLTNGLSKDLIEISCLPSTEIDEIWQHNSIAPLAFDEALNRVRADVSTSQGSIYPPAVVPWVCNPRNPDQLSAIGCVGELWLEGSILPGETTNSPSWLVQGSSSVAGRSGKVQATGDMVQLGEGNTLKFVGRKENVLIDQGHFVDLASLESHVQRHLPLSSRAAAAAFQLPSKNLDEEPTQQLAIFVEQSSTEGVTFTVLPEKHEITSAILTQEDHKKITLCEKVSEALIIALKKFDKFAHDSLPPYLVPTVYIVVEKITNDDDQTLLSQLARSIPEKVLNQLRSGMNTAWADSSVQTDLTPAENILRTSWANVLGIDAGQIDVDDNFFRRGGDSVLAMKLISHLRAQGHGLTVADIFQHMRLGDAALSLKMNQYVSQQTTQAYKPFSILGHMESNVDVFLSEIVKPKLLAKHWSIQDVYPVTASQALDIQATIHAPRTSFQYTMLYFDDSVDLSSLSVACNRLVQTHEILRTVFVEHDSSYYQVVLESIDVLVTRSQTKADLKQAVADLCAVDIEKDIVLGAPFLKFHHVEGNDGKHCLIIGLSHAQYDGESLPRLLRDLETLFTGGKIADVVPFTSYMSHTYNPELQNKAAKYWRRLLDGSSLSVLDGKSIQSTGKAVFHEKIVDIAQRPEEITMANLLIAAWALVLARRLGQQDVTFGNVTSGRTLDLASIENVNGPCYQLAPTRVPFEPQWTSMDLLRYVQKQSAESAAHDFLGFQEIAKKCTPWGSEAKFFDSVVHHQVFEDFDDMPFGSGSCKVDISIPHGDAAHPIKAVSFFRDGQTHVGVVGSESQVDYVDAILDDLVQSIQELGKASTTNLLKVAC